MIYSIWDNGPIAPDVYRMRLIGPTETILSPGQFLHLQVPGYYLRRPISICDWTRDTIDIVYKLVGGGTRELARLGRGDKLDALGPLGNGFSIADAGEKPLLIGGGVGVPPLVGLARRLLLAGKTPTALLGFNTEKEILLTRDFEAMGVKIVLTTADGSRGVRGFVTDALNGLSYDSFCACGPEMMLRAVCAACETSGQVSLESRMACGIGACMGCTIQTRSGARRVCKDGPVFSKEEMIW